MWPGLRENLSPISITYDFMPFCCNLLETFKLDLIFLCSSSQPSLAHFLCFFSHFLSCNVGFRNGLFLGDVLLKHSLELIHKSVNHLTQYSNLLETIQLIDIKLWSLFIGKSLCDIVSACIGLVFTILFQRIYIGQGLLLKKLISHPND